MTAVHPPGVNGVKSRIYIHNSKRRILIDDFTLELVVSGWGHDEEREPVRARSHRKASGARLRVRPRVKRNKNVFVRHLVNYYFNDGVAGMR